MKQLWTICCVLFIAAAMLKCEQKTAERRHPELQQLWECYNQSEWTADSLNTQLTGQWKWFYVESPWVAEGLFTEEENFVVEFSGDSTLYVLADGHVQDTVHYSLEPENGGNYKLSLHHGVQHLYGFIVLCEDVLVFNDSYRDGTDDYFYRVKLAPLELHEE